MKMTPAAPLDGTCPDAIKCDTSTTRMLKVRTPSSVPRRGPRRSVTFLKGPGEHSPGTLSVGHCGEGVRQGWHRTKDGCVSDPDPLAPPQEPVPVDRQREGS